WKRKPRGRYGVQCSLLSVEPFGCLSALSSPPLAANVRTPPPSVVRSSLWGSLVSHSSLYLSLGQPCWRRSTLFGQLTDPSTPRRWFRAASVSRSRCAAPDLCRAQW